MAICSCSRRSNLMRCLQASCSGWGQSDISCHPTSFTTLISGSGRKPSPMRSHGLHHVYAKERALGTSMSRLRETSTSILQKNAARHRPDAISRWVLQRVHFLSQEIEDAGSRGHDYQHRVGQDTGALANGDKAQRDVPSPRANILWHAAASIIAAARG